MRSLFFILLIAQSAFCATGSWNGVAFTHLNGIAQTAWNGTTISCGSSTSYLINQNFEGTGYDNSETWTEAGTGTVDEDEATIVLTGSQSMRITAAGTQPRVISPSFTAQAEVWVYWQVHMVSLPGSTLPLMWVRDGANAQVMRVRITSAGLLNIQSATGGANTVDALSTGTMYHIWAHYLKGTGANAVVDVGFSTDGVRPTSGNKFRQLTNGDATTDATNLLIGTTANYTMEWVTDRVLADDAQIGNSP